MTASDPAILKMANLALYRHGTAAAYYVAKQIDELKAAGKTDEAEKWTRVLEVVWSKLLPGG